MKIDKNNNTFIFENDDELYNFAVIPEYVVVTDEMGNQGMGWNFTEDYLDAVAGNGEFLMNDLNSRCLKHQVIDFRGVSKPINICGNYEKIFEDIDNEFECNDKKCKNSKK
jgi:hypothetical protein